MQPTNVDIKSLFGNKVQFRIPLFQRHYVWSKEDQWLPLWEDIKEKSNHYLSQQKKNKFTHFTGAIVIQQKSTNPDEVNKYEIIDGQQRLTTFQVILCALRDICTSLEFNDIADEVKSYTINSGMLSHNYKDEQYKLIPTEFDKPSLKALVIGTEGAELSDKNGRIYKSYEYFKEHIQNYAMGERKRLLSLFHSILNDFGLVQILIDSDDESELIFESLNGRGKSLLQFDLLRNNLFLRTRKSEEEDRDELYHKYWSHFETNFWEEEINVANRKIILSELFFQHFLTAKLATDSVFPLFKTYQREYRKELENNRGSTYELSELCRYSKVYQDIITCDKDSDIGHPMKFYKTLDITSLYSFVLFMKNEFNTPALELQYIFRILESYTIRRMLCTTQNHRNFNKFFSEVIKKLKTDKFNIAKFISILSHQTSSSRKWPRNNEVKNSFNGHWTKINVNRNVIRYILYSIELLNRGENKFGEQDEMPFNQFTLEHVMPEIWKQNWSLPLPEGSVKYEAMFSEDYKKSHPLTEDEVPSRDGLLDESYLSAFELALERDCMKQSIGNLTVVTVKLNSRLSNGSFEDKKQSLFNCSALLLNKDIYMNENWDVKQIREREERLYANFCALWPDIDWFEKNIPY